jgi:hypothetical protein
MRHRIMKFAFLLTLGSAVLFAGPFQNGGFESPVIGAGPDFTTVPTGWTKFDPSCGAANCSGPGLFMQTYAAFGLPTTGGQGNQAFGFGGNGITTGSVLQTFDTLNGARLPRELPIRDSAGRRVRGSGGGSAERRRLRHWVEFRRLHCGERRLPG